MRNTSDRTRFMPSMGPETMWRSQLPLLLRVLTAAISAASVRVGLAATSHSLREILGAVYTAYLVRIAAFSCCFASIIIWNTATFPPAAFAAVGSLVYAAASACGLHTVAIVALCLTGGSIATAASRESLVFITAAVTGSVAASVAPLAEAATGPPHEVMTAASAAVLFALSCLYIFFRVPYGDEAESNGRVSRPPPHRRRPRSPYSHYHGAEVSVLGRLRRASSLTRQRLERGSVGRPLFTAVTVAVTSAALVLVVIAPIGWQVRRFLLRPALPKGYQVIAQKRSVTGLVSVVEDHNREIRFLTCDHSVLGGIYISDQFYGENIFGQFHVHEAVRLSRKPGEIAGEETGGSEGRALCIGLGIGVVANALHALGSHVDAVEIDPAVAFYAREYFHFRPENLHVEDAQKFLESARSFVYEGDMAPYDYVVHDVFTGGTVPLNLFSVDTFSAVQDVMAQDGVLVVNFVGAVSNDPSLTGGEARKAKQAFAAVAAVAARLRALFPFVRAFSDGEESSVHNIVFFASSEENRVQFREVTDRDMMRSGIRENALMSFEEHELGPEIMNFMDASQATDKVINGGQWVTAAEHWRVVRKEFTNELWPAMAS